MRDSRTRLAAMAAFSIAFGFCEAATVAYIRLVARMAPALDYRQVWQARGLPLNGNTIISEMSRFSLLPVEYGREIATIVMLATIAILAGRNRAERAACFVFVFTIWDLAYYAWLALFSGFPHALIQTDIYFLLPFPTFGPVWFPLLIMMSGLIWSLRRLNIEY